MTKTMHLWRRWKQRAYGYREEAFASLVFGIYLHASRLVFGAELVERYLLRPAVDEALGVMLAYAAVAGITGWRSLRFRSIGHRRLSRFILGFIAVSAPIHLTTFFRASAARISVLPWWYSFVEAALLYPLFAVALWRLGRASAADSETSIQPRIVVAAQPAVGFLIDQAIILRRRFPAHSVD